MSDNLQKKTFSGFIWTFGQTFSLEAFSFLQGIIMARLLFPSDYGLIAMTNVFYAISNCFIDSGFGTALIRKPNKKAIDYSTVYVTNVVLTLFFALLLFLCSPLIADFYHEPILKDIVRVNSVLMVMNSFNAVQGTRMRIHLQFKQLSIANVTVTIVVGVASIVMAFMGYGVWALIYPHFLSPFLRWAFYWHYQHWHPGLSFSWRIWKEYFGFGSKLLISGLLDTIWANIYPIVIGKKFSAADLGQFSRGRSYAYLPVSTFQGVLSQVTFPVLSAIQNDDERLRSAYRRLIRLSGYVTFPMVMGMAALAKPLVFVIITEKWSECVPYLQVICFAAMWYPIHALNLNLLKVKGRSDLFLILEIAKKTLSAIVIVIAIPFGIFCMCVGSVVTSFLCLFINTYYTGKLIKVGYMTQMKDLLPCLFYSLSMCVLVWGVTQMIPSMLLRIGVGIPLGIVYYLGISKLFKSQELDYAVLLIKENLIKRYGK